MGEAKRFRFENNVHGFAPVVPLALKGVPNSMLNMIMKPIKAKVVDVLYDMTVSCGIRAEQQMKAGREVLAAVIDLEKQGYRFNIYAAITFTGGKDADIICIKIKSAEQPLDIKRVSFPMAHTGFFRVIGFDWYSKVPGGEYRSGYGRGAYYNWGKEDSKEILEALTGRKNVIYFSAAEIVNRNRNKDEIKEELSRMPLNPIYITHRYTEYTHAIQDIDTHETVEKIKSTLQPMGFYMTGLFAEWVQYNVNQAINAAINTVESMHNELNI
jgi:hypothetical protein